MRKPMRNLAGARQLAMAALFTAGLLWATNKGPDAGNYTATDNTVFSFLDPGGSGSAPSKLTGTDDGGALLTLPFSFQFYGQSYTMVCVSSNGIAYFVTSATFCGSAAQTVDFANTDLTSTAVPGDLPAIAPFWTDLTFAPAGAGAVYYQTVGTAPNQQFIIEWYNAFPASSLTPVTFEAVLSQGSNNVLFQYQAVNLGNGIAASNGAQATIGIRNTAGSTNNQEIEWSYDSAVLSNSYSIAFNAPSSTATSVNTITTSPSGISVTIDGQVMATPAVVSWVPNTSHTLAVSTPQTNGGTETTLSSWSTSETTAQISVQAQANGSTYTANFTTSYELTATVTPANTGTIAAAGQFYAANSTISVQAAPVAGYKLTGFSGDLTGTANPQNLLMNGPKNVIATFALGYACSVSGGASAAVSDVQSLINQALGKSGPANDINSDGIVNVIDVKIVINAVLGQGCVI
jgi:hypothetical protein